MKKMYGFEKFHGSIWFLGDTSHLQWNDVYQVVNQHTQNALALEVQQINYLR